MKYIACQHFFAMGTIDLKSRFLKAFISSIIVITLFLGVGFAAEGAARYGWIQDMIFAFSTRNYVQKSIQIFAYFIQNNEAK